MLYDVWEYDSVTTIETAERIAIGIDLETAATLLNCAPQGCRRFIELTIGQENEHGYS